MRRTSVLAIVAVVACAGPVFAGAPAPLRPTAERFASVPVVVAGKVTAIEKDTVDAAPFPGAKDKIAHRVAVVKISDGIAGAKEVTHVKIGFVPPAKVDPAKPPVGRPPRFSPIPELKEGQEMLFFLSKHPDADFYVMTWANPPIDITTEVGKKELELVKKCAVITADPMKALKSDKAEARTEAAVLLALKYRAYPEGATATEEVAIPADESKLILKALAEGEWKQERFDVPGPMRAFYALGLTEKDGWKPPAFPPPKAGDPLVDFNTIQKEAFVKWLGGPGKDFAIKKIVAKQK